VSATNWHLGAGGVGVAGIADISGIKWGSSRAPEGPVQGLRHQARSDERAGAAERANAGVVKKKGIQRTASTTIKIAASRTAPEGPVQVGHQGLRRRGLLSARTPEGPVPGVPKSGDPKSPRLSKSLLVPQARMVLRDFRVVLWG
jgi:hypothetical protein